jgi:hypothetical protein
VVSAQGVDHQHHRALARISAAAEQAQPKAESSASQPNLHRRMRLSRSQPPMRAKTLVAASLAISQPSAAAPI